MTCHRCRTSTCPGCPVEVDCRRCHQPTDLAHTDDRGRCPECAEALAAESLADADVQPEVIRAAVEAARADERRTVVAAIVADILAGAESLESEARRMAAGRAFDVGRTLRFQNATVYRYLAGRIRTHGAVSP